jgi:hypothetical protein
MKVTESSGFQEICDRILPTLGGDPAAATVVRMALAGTLSLQEAREDLRGLGGAKAEAGSPLANAFLEIDSFAERVAAEEARRAQPASRPPLPPQEPHAEVVAASRPVYQAAPLAPAEVCYRRESCLRLLSHFFAPEGVHWPEADRFDARRKPVDDAFARERRNVWTGLALLRAFSPLLPPGDPVATLCEPLRERSESRTTLHEVNAALTQVEAKLKEQLAAMEVEPTPSRRLAEASGILSKKRDQFRLVRTLLLEELTMDVLEELQPEDIPERRVQFWEDACVEVAELARQLPEDEPMRTFLEGEVERMGRDDLNPRIAASVRSAGLLMRFIPYVMRALTGSL